MKQPSGRRWLVGAVGLFLVLLVVWFAAAMRISASAAAPSNLMSSLRSRLTANYAPDPAGSTVHSLRLSIFEEVLQDMGISGGEAVSQSHAIQEQLQGPVPTATARDFQGARPHTATPTQTPLPTETPTPTVTNTPRPRPTRTKTPLPTMAPPTNSPAPPSVDTTDPQICCIDLNPVPTGSLGVCTIDVTDLEAFDVAFSSGINPSEVFIKYREKTAGSWQKTPLAMTSGGFVVSPGSDWRGHFRGSFTIHGVLAGQTIEVKGLAGDNAGNYGSGGSGPYMYMLTIGCP
jgi:hypothetical protein